MSKKLGERLVEAGLISAAAVNQALEQQRLTGHRLGDCLVEMGFLPEATLLRFLASEFKTRYVSAEKLARAQIPTELLDRVPVRMAESSLFLPLAVDNERRILSIVAAEPQNEDLLREIALVAEVDEVFAYVGLRSVIYAGIQKHYYGDTTAFQQLATGVLRAPVAARTDLAGIAQAYEASGSNRTAPPPVRLRLRGESSQARLPHTVVRGKRESASALVSSRGAVGENDYLETLRVLVDLLEKDKGELRGHSAQLARQCALVALRMALPARDVACVALAAFLHDLGKGPLHLTLAGTARNPEWKAQAKQQVRMPLQMFESVHLPAQANSTLAQIFEAFDGSGTPQGVRGDDIAIGARILAAVDSYLDLTRNSANAYGRRYTRDQALNHMAEQAGVLYDPRVVQTLEQLLSGELLRRRLEADGRMVLLAEPDAPTRDALVQALEQRGLVVQACSTLETVADAALAGDGDVWVLSAAFGPADLLDVVAHLRSQPALAGLPVVITGEPEAGLRERFLQAGVTVVVPAGNSTEVAFRVSELFQDRVAHGGPAHSVWGTFEELATRDVLRTLGAGRKSGRLTLRDDATEGFLQLERGRVTFAALDERRGEEALGALLKVHSAEFTYDADALLLEVPQLDTDVELVLRALEA
jgi:HD-GYP domain-containing protein (c-di-GMP phosphodiesterase class II)